MKRTMYFLKINTGNFSLINLLLKILQYIGEKLAAV